MARIRTIKPTFWDHEQLGRASALARLTFAGLISQADDEGRGRADSDWLWGRLHAFAPSGLRATWARTLSELSALADDSGPLVVFYKVAGASYYWLPGFCKQQYIERPSKSTIPSPPNSGNVPLALLDDSPQEGKGREGKGREGKGRERPPPSSPSAGTPDPSPEKPTERDLDSYVASIRLRDPSLPPATIKREIGRAARAGVSPDRLLEDLSKMGDRLKLWAIIDLYEHPSRKNGNGAAEPTRVNQNPQGHVPPCLKERREAVQKRQDEARAKCREILLGMDPQEREGRFDLARDAAEAAKIFPAGVDSFVESRLLQEIAKEHGIEGL
jgi:hypothetical protein